MAQCNCQIITKMQDTSQIASCLKIYCIGLDHLVILKWSIIYSYNSCKYQYVTIHCNYTVPAYVVYCTCKCMGIWTLGITLDP